MFFKHELDDSRYQKSVQSTSLLPSTWSSREAFVWLENDFFCFCQENCRIWQASLMGELISSELFVVENQNSEGTVKRGKTVEKNRFEKMIWTRIFLEKPIKCIPTDSYLLVRYGNLGKFFYLGKIITNNFTRVKKFTQVPVPNY